MSIPQLPHHPTVAAAESSASRVSPPPTGVRVVTDAVRDASVWIPRVKRELSRVIVGHDHLIDRLLLALLADGHVLLEGAPGIGKRLVVRTLAAALGCEFRHLPCTSDLDRTDLVGTQAERGPIFSDVLLAEDLEQAPPKVRATLVQAMLDREIRVDTTLLPLPDPFFLVATCSHDSSEGACRLTAAQRDRFLLKVVVPMPDADQERDMIDVASPGLRTPEIRPGADAALIRRARMVLAAIYMDGSVKDYVVRLVHATRRPTFHGLPPADHLRFEASPRATLGLVAAAKAHAFLDGRGYAEHEDVQAVALDVLRHRVEALPDFTELEGPTSEDFIQRILEAVPVD